MYCWSSTSTFADDSSHAIVSGHTLQQEVQSLVAWDRKNKCSTISNISPLLAIYANTNIASLYLIYTYYCYAQMKIKCLLKYIHINEQYSLPFNSSLEYLHAPVYALYNLCIKLFISDIYCCGHHLAVILAAKCISILFRNFLCRNKQHNV